MVIVNSIISSHSQKSSTFIAGYATESFLRNNSIQILVELVVAELHIDKPLPEKKKKKTKINQTNPKHLNYHIICFLFHLMLIFHFLQIFPKILKGWTIIGILSPAVLHDFVPTN